LRFIEDLTLVITTKVKSSNPYFKAKQPRLALNKNYHKVCYVFKNSS
jgi:hypothetical protein